MNETEDKNTSPDLESRIDLAMDKIIQDTIGHIPVSEQIDNPDTKKKNKKEPKVKEPKKRTAKPESTEPPVYAETLGPPEEEEDMPEKKKGIAGKIILVLFVLALLSGIGVYGYYAHNYSDKFFPGTTINNIDCEGLTADQAEALIKKKVEDYRIDLKFRGDEIKNFEGQTIAYSYAPDGSVDKAQKEQNPLLWIKGYFEPAHYEVAENITYDENALREQVMALDCMQPEAMQAPADAYIAFQNGHFEIVPEVEGTTIDTEAFFDAVKEAVSQSVTELSAEEQGVYAQPAVRSSDETLNRQVEELNSLTTASIIYQLPTGEEVLNGNTIRDWLSIDENGHYYKDEAVMQQKIAEYVADMASRVDTAGKDRPFTTTSGLEITVGGGDYGWKINQAEEIAELTKNIANNDQIAREPVYTSREVSTENNGFGNTYIEINLTDQELYYYQDGQIVVQSSFVSGKMTRDRYTPPGIFTLTYKQKDRVLRGDKLPDGSYSYESPVNYWMPFNGGIGLHDASWRGSFGGTIYKNGGSHGCINLPYSKAQAIYNIITKDVPIICFYTEQYSLR
ncbi:L,D-transpeptidase family protein [Ruminococcus gauvreauii]|uniref:L,D-transpeptidase family protein n=1 Tax=Ruminococcus gauvreauii TaxID=438033 RepID=UPI0039840160